VLYSLVSGIWNVFARLALPVIALLVMATASRPGASLITAAAAGLALLIAAAGRIRPAAAQRALLAPGRPHAAARPSPSPAGSHAGRRPPDAAGWLPGFPEEDRGPR